VAIHIVYYYNLFHIKNGINDQYQGENIINGKGEHGKLEITTLEKPDRML